MSVMPFDDSANKLLAEAYRPHVQCAIPPRASNMLAEARRRNNIALLNEVLDSLGSNAAKRTGLLNMAKVGLDKLTLHIAAEYGSCECIANDIIATA